MTRTFWLSFIDRESRPHQHLGVCVVDVDEAEVDAYREEFEARFPNHQPGAEWIAMACRKAHDAGCNPGGEVGSSEIPTTWEVPRDRLLVGAEIERWRKSRVH
jgi:hypothetical protein